jgi:hypothetical protein
MKGQSTLSTSVVYASLIVLWFALISHPLRKDDSDTFLQEIIPINVAIRLLVNPLRVPSKDNELQIMMDLSQYIFTSGTTFSHMMRKKLKVLRKQMTLCRLYIKP